MENTIDRDELIDMLYEKAIKYMKACRSEHDHGCRNLWFIHTGMRSGIMEVIAELTGTTKSQVYKKAMQMMEK